MSKPKKYIVYNQYKQAYLKSVSSDELQVAWTLQLEEAQVLHSKEYADKLARNAGGQVAEADSLGPEYPWLESLVGLTITDAIGNINTPWGRCNDGDFQLVLSNGKTLRVVGDCHQNHGYVEAELVDTLIIA